jgi:EAL domain-containing protein (putative c-di-GMP-specific phosphodiesterase class I)
VARAFGTKTIAEWIENDAALNIVRGMGIDFVQGFGVGKPEPLQVKNDE